MGGINNNNKTATKKQRAPVAGRYAVIISGNRHVVYHESGEPLKGEIEGYSGRNSYGRKVAY